MRARWLRAARRPGGDGRGGRARPDGWTSTSPGTRSGCGTSACAPSGGGRGWPAAAVERGDRRHAGSGCCATTPAPAASTSTSAGRRPGASRPPSGRRTRPRWSTPDDRRTQQLLEIADELYALPLEEFTPARDARAKELKGDKELAAAVKKLKKPSVAAWVVNLLRTPRGRAGRPGASRSATALREAQEGMDGAGAAGADQAAAAADLGGHPAGARARHATRASRSPRRSPTRSRRP